MEKKIKVFYKKLEEDFNRPVELRPLESSFIQKDLDDVCKMMELFRQHDNEVAFEKYQSKLAGMTQVLFSIGYMLVDENNKKVSAYDFVFSS